MTLRYLTDGARHLVCEPYSVENLHRMASELKIARCWFHRDHYDIPKRRVAEIEARCEHISTKEIVSLTGRARKVAFAGKAKGDNGNQTSFLPGFEL